MASITSFILDSAYYVFITYIICVIILTVLYIVVFLVPGAVLIPEILYTILHNVVVIFNIVALIAMIYVKYSETKKK